jgi:hypothetical protein
LFNFPDGLHLEAVCSDAQNAVHLLDNVAVGFVYDASNINTF